MVRLPLLPLVLFPCTPRLSFKDDTAHTEAPAVSEAPDPDTHDPPPRDPQATAHAPGGWFWPNPRARVNLTL